MYLLSLKQLIIAMADREDNVYKAKLAEQAERYDGMWYHSDDDYQ